MEQILAKCPNPECGKEYPVSEERAGQVMHCTQCGEDFTAGGGEGVGAREDGSVGGREEEGVGGRGDGGGGRC